MFFKKGKDGEIEEKLREIEERIKGIKNIERSEKETSEESIKEKVYEKKELSGDNFSIQPPEKKEPEDISVPLFVKIDKYRNIVSSLMQIKTYLITLKNTIVAIEQLERARVESLSALSKTIEKINEKITELENNLVKPIGFSFGVPETVEELSTVHSAISSLKSQIEELKAELEKT
ncbi:MAG: hypothetical protein QXW01_00425 [Candidatus Aenigmatarchaeota archaeon]